ncbi:hypothetical protein WA026_020428 [Henosepilachna vigintioctopunctata]|uniref:SIAH-type domain-containing protein n=1 Tax=Henosepilachna vigintioctopunctata TaxID=420089 RepID=A0AAW1UF53_9CUCU
MESNENSSEYIPIKKFVSLSCGMCQEVLSVPPISFDCSLGVICGRCKTTVELLEGKTYRLIAYESLANYFKFPCKFEKKGCPAMLKWGEVLDHEISCEYLGESNPGDGSLEGVEAANHLKFPSDWNKDSQDSSRLQFDEKLYSARIKKKSMNFPKGIGVKCNNCASYLKFPVYICSSSHNICSNCWLDEEEEEEKFNHCSICFTSLTRNTGMERLSYFLEYPCKNVQNGCTYTESFPNIEKHERTCGYSKKCCLTNCEYKGKHLFTHVSSTHKIDKLGTPYKLTSCVSRTFIFDHQVFSFSGNFSAREGLKFEIICRGTNETYYTFQIQIMDNIYTEISIQDVCIPEYQEFKDITTQFSIEELMRKMFISGEMIQQLFSDYESLIIG